MPKARDKVSTTPDNEVQSLPDSTSELQCSSSKHTKTITGAPVPKTYIRMPKRGFPSEFMPENYVRLDQITDELYEKFCKEVLDETPQKCTPRERRLLDNMCSSGNFGAAVDFYDEIMGELPVVMVHILTSKVLLSPSLRQKCIEKVIAVKKSEPNPICAALRHIQQLFVGFPPEIRLRHMLVAELEKQEPGLLSEEEKRLMALPPSARFNLRTSSVLGRSSVKESSQQKSMEATSRRTSSRLISKSREAAGVGSKNGVDKNPSTNSPIHTVKSTAKSKPMNVNLMVPLDDHIYEKIAEVLSERCSLESIEDDSLRLAIEKIRASNELLVEFWLEEHFFCPPGLRLRVNDEYGRILLRKSEVTSVWRMFYDRMNGCSHADILNAIEERYVGIATKANIREVSKYDLLKGPRVVFPAPPRCIGRKPMQYVQIDVVAMEATMYGERSYSQALFLTDLYSGYTFARALTDSPDLAIIVRHAMDIFGSFGPPEAYRTFTTEYSSVIADVMLDIERLFKIPIKNIGVGGNLTRDLVRALYRRAEAELLASNRWVEALPFAVLEQNQHPSKFFDPTRTPFEIMFGRHAWRDEPCPPWVNPMSPEEIEDPSRSSSIKKEKERYLVNEERVYEPPHLDSIDDLKMYANSLVESRKRIKTQMLPVYVPVYGEDGKLVNPGTGYMFQVFDRVYVRNPHFQFECRSSKLRPHIARYYRGVIVDIDYDLVDSMYKVSYWEDNPHQIDLMGSSDWPVADDTYDCCSSWFGPWDVTASTAHLAKLRAVPAEFCNDHMVTKRQTIDMRCRCETPGCVGFANMRCSRKLSTECCLKSPYDCAYHKRNGRSPQVEVDSSTVSDGGSHSPSTFQHSRTPRFRETSGLLAYPIKSDGFSTVEERTLSNSHSRHSEKRYTFRDGLLVEVSGGDLNTLPRRGAPPVLRKRRLSEPEEVILPSVGSHERWFTQLPSEERSEIASTSDETYLMQFANSDADSLRSTTPSPTPSACYEVEISPEDSTRSFTPEAVESISHDMPRSKPGVSRARDYDTDHDASKSAWNIPEISLRPRVVPRRDHPYERKDSVVRVSPSVKSMVIASMAKRLEKSEASEKRLFSSNKRPSRSRHLDESPTSVSHGTRGFLRFSTALESVPHVHPFDAELMEEVKEVDVMKTVDDDSQEEGSHAALASSAGVSRQVYGVKSRTAGTNRKI
ncbi:hypothetical protein KIN20_013047 [Parelaphostrongylus tenuis]|uniref:Uncharacterized protein n=1 Tax=Parelaphostrongylus tenuis TaxID=148309 RepID=A0AAD5QKQ7_PARTN|nr:hypothetical protein KIN20_013047 [Parelaphostrongylus tenuis]